MPLAVWRLNGNKYLYRACVCVRFRCLFFYQITKRTVLTHIVSHSHVHAFYITSLQICMGMYMQYMVYNLNRYLFIKAQLCIVLYCKCHVHILDQEHVLNIWWRDCPLTLSVILSVSRSFWKYVRCHCTINIAQLTTESNCGSCLLSSHFFLSIPLTDYSFSSPFSKWITLFLLHFTRR